MMRIGVDATCWLNNRGYGRHVRALLNSLVRLDTDNKYIFVIDSTNPLDDLPEQVEVRVVKSSIPTALAAAADGRRSIGDMWRMSRALSAPDFDVLLYPALYSFVPSFSQAKKLIIIHDIIPEKFPELTFPKRLPRLFWQLKSALGRFQADAIITISEYSRQGILEIFKIPPQRVFVVGLASDPVFRVIDDPTLTPNLVDLGIRVEDKNIVFVGGFGPHKNLTTLVTVFSRIASLPEFADLKLVMVGEYKKEVFFSEYETIWKQIEKLGITDRVKFTGYLSDEELVILLNVATVLVLPSLIEGYGLPAVEAAACGCPVIATRESPLSDLLGEGGVYIDPHNPIELEQALIKVLSSEEQRLHMRTAGLNAARLLTWEAAARQLKKLLNRVVTDEPSS